MVRPSWLGCGIVALAAWAATAPEPQAAPARAVPQSDRRRDLLGDDMPPHAVTRLGTVRFRGPLTRGPDIRTLCTLRGNRAVVVDAESGKLIHHFPGPDPHTFEAASFLVSPDKRYVAYGGTGGLEVYDRVSGERIATWTFNEDEDDTTDRVCRPLAFLRDGTGLIIQHQAGAGVVECLDIERRSRRWRLGLPLPNGEWSFQFVGVRTEEPAIVLLRPDAAGSAAWLVSSLTGEMGYTFAVHTDERLGVAAVSPDGRQLAVGDPDRVIRIHHLGTGQEMRSFAPKPGRFDSVGGQYLSLAYSPDGRMLAATSDIGIAVFDVAAGKSIFRHTSHAYYSEEASSAIFSADSRYLWVNHYEALAWRCFDLSTGHERKLPDHGHRAHISSVAISPNGMHVATAAAEESVRLWDANTGKLIRRLTSGGLFLFGSPDLMGYRALAFSPDGKLFAGLTSTLSSSGLANRLVVWDPVNGRVRRMLTVPGDAFGEGSAMAFSPDGRMVAVAACENVAGQNGADHFVRLFDVATGRPTGKITGLSAAPNMLSFSPDGRSLAVTSRYTEDGSALVVCDIAAGRPCRTGPANTNAAAYLPYGDLIVLIGESELVVWELLSGQARLKLPLPQGETIDAIAVSPEGRWVAGINVGSGSRQVHLWDLQQGRVLPSMAGHEHMLTAVSFARNGRLTTGSQDSTGLVWQLPVSPELPPPPDPEAAWVALADNAELARRAIESLVAYPKAAFKLIHERLQPMGPPDVVRIERLLEQLDSRRFSVRQHAAAELAALDLVAVPFLQRFQASAPSAEAAGRAGQLIARLGGSVLLPERLRELRCVEVLQRLGDAEAQRRLEDLAAGEPSARLTIAARRVLDLMSGRRAGL